MKYTINVNYDTGDSFSQQPDQNETVELEWESLDIAKENLISIKEHYDFYKAMSNSSWNVKDSDIENIKKEAKTKPWHINSGNDWKDRYSLKLKADNGNWMNIYCFWCGYFEHMNYAEIIPAKSELDKSTDTRIYS